jgi:hypothetical protein
MHDDRIGEQQPDRGPAAGRPAWALRLGPLHVDADDGRRRLTSTDARGALVGWRGCPRRHGRWRSEACVQHNSTHLLLLSWSSPQPSACLQHRPLVARICGSPFCPSPAALVRCRLMTTLRGTVYRRLHASGATAGLGVHSRAHPFFACCRRASCVQRLLPLGVCSLLGY